ncbi:phospholipid transport system transporter-binding protein [Oceanospirillum multiglobuliferum]|uniref:STAS domain-containing protein n=1 Tax=Oceanospirillum multiglobuliferum TaxID=64969 RepID=A0A1T4KTI6_9GAMM|nr:STAS domain-containing protein [Oceanospirillum multiglobuliferum]OPX54936.1 hypothetical protein BTE48_11375 [Oceanospirillum multiglobuliferum]SJZ45755.1 phospholipid transport system transporter-binding protein [Oceanospirillum multiglobuliferum]
MTQIIALQPNHLLVSGDLDFSGVLLVRSSGEALIRQAPEEVVIDFSGVERAGSAAVSLMMCWLRTACQEKRQIRFTQLPELLKKIITVSGLTENLFIDQC